MADSTVLLIATILAVIGLGLWLVFRDTLNKFQCLPWGDRGKYRLYWIARDDGDPDQPLVSWAFLHLMVYPWLNGHGIQFQYKHWTFQVGVGQTAGYTSPDDGILGQMGGRELDLTVDEIKEWSDGKDVQEEA